METTVPSSTHCLPERIPKVAVETRVSECGGVLGKGHRVASLGRGAPDFGRTELGVPQNRERHRDEAARVGPHHSSMCQSLYALSTASARSLSSAAANKRPLKPGKEGKLIEARTPPAFMSLMRSCTS